MQIPSAPHMKKRVVLSQRFLYSPVFIHTDSQYIPLCRLSLGKEDTDDRRVRSFENPITPRLNDSQATNVASRSVSKTRVTDLESKFPSLSSHYKRRLVVCCACRIRAGGLVGVFAAAITKTGGAPILTTDK